MTFVRRKIDVVITLGKGDFGDAGASDTVTLSGLRVAANIVKGKSPSYDWADIRIYGMTQSQMNTASRLGKPINFTRNNTIQIMAGDDVSGMTLVFAGTIQTCSQNFQDAPNTCLNIGAQGGGQAAMAAIKPVSIKGSGDVATIMQTIAASMGLTLENNGVSVQISNPYLPGTATEQMRRLAEAANIYAMIDSVNNTLAIWPKDGSRAGVVPLIAAETGMIGYPTYADVGVELRALYFPGVHVGGNIVLKSKSVPRADGLWNVMHLTLDLESETPGGAWHQSMVCWTTASGPVPS